MAMTVEEFIEHHGVKGMHWGVRKSRTTRPPSAESRKVSELRKRKPSQLSNKQLQTVNARLNLERNFKQMNPSTVAKGHSAIKGFLAGVGTVTTLYATINSPAGKAAIAAGEKFLKKKVA